MTVTIQLADETIDALKAIAHARGVSLDEYIRDLAEHAVPRASASMSSEQALKDFDAALDDLFQGDVEDLPAATSTYSRGDIYFDHD